MCIRDRDEAKLGSQGAGRGGGEDITPAGLDVEKKSHSRQQSTWSRWKTQLHSMECSTVAEDNKSENLKLSAAFKIFGL